MMDITLILASIILIAVVYLYFARPNDFVAKQGIPSPPGLPFFGNWFQVMRLGFIGSHIYNREKYGKIVGFRMFGQTTVIIYDVELLKQVLIKDSNAFTDHQSSLFKFPRPFDKGITVLKGDEWRRVRHAITPTFTSGKLKKMTGLIGRSVNILVDTIQKFADEKQDVDVKDIYSRFTLTVIADTMFGMEIDAMTNVDNEFSRHVKKFMTHKPILLLIFLLRSIPGVKQFLNKFMPYAGFETTSLNFLVNGVEQAIEARRGREDQYPDFLSLMLKAEISEEDAEQKEQKVRGLTNEEIIAQSIIFMLAGYETTSTALSYMSYLFAMHPEYQEQCREEVLEHYCDETPEQLYDSISRMTLLDQCLKEALRLYPPASATDRVANRDVKVGDIIIPKDKQVTVPIYAMLHDPEYYQEPATFNPSRFADHEGESGRVPFNFLAFGAGPRNCVGMRFALLDAKLALAKILKHLQIVTCEKTPNEPVEFTFAGPSKPKKPIILRFERLD